MKSYQDHGRKKDKGIPYKGNTRLKSRNQSKKNVKYYKCHQMVHFKKGCLNKKHGYERNGDGFSNSASIVERDSDFGYGDMLLVSVGNSNKLHDSWGI